MECTTGHCSVTPAAKENMKVQSSMEAPGTPPASQRRSNRVVPKPRSDNFIRRSNSQRQDSSEEDLKAWLSQMLERHQSIMQGLLVNHQEALRDSIGGRFDRSFKDGLKNIQTGVQNPLLDSMISWQQAKPPDPVMSSSKEANFTTDATIVKPEVRERNSIGSQQSVPPADPNASFPPARASYIARAKLGVDHRIMSIVKSASFDYFMGVIIVINMLCMFIQLEYSGYQSAVFLGKQVASEKDWVGADIAFQVLEEIFTVVYIVEFGLRVWAYKTAYFKDGANLLDASVVVSSTVDAYIMRPINGANGTGGNPAGKLIRVLRVVRVLKIMRILTKFAELRVLMRAVVESASAFLWSMLLAAVVIVAGAIFMAQLSSVLIADGDISKDTRQWLYRYYGSASLATFTMFEVTFSGAWPSRARRTVEDVSPLFGFFWAVYVLLITFALIRLVAAMFLKQTMAVAQSDKEKMLMEKMKLLTDLFKSLFETADTSNDGLLSSKELHTALAKKEVKSMLDQVELTGSDLTHLFHLLEDADGCVDQETFVSGALRLKGTVRATDAISMTHEQRKIQHGIILLGEGLESLFDQLRLENRWRFSRFDPRTVRQTHLRALS